MGKHIHEKRRHLPERLHQLAGLCRRAGLHFAGGTGVDCVAWGPWESSGRQGGTVGASLHPPP